MLGPDVAFVATDRLTGIESDETTYAVGAPDVAVEILSPSNRAGEVNAKVLAYLEAGCRQVWIVDPERRTVAVHTPDGLARLHREDDTLDGGDALVGLSVRVGDLLA